MPILPQPWQFIVPDEKKQQFEIVRSLLNRPDVDLSLIHIWQLSQDEQGWQSMDGAALSCDLPYDPHHAGKALPQPGLGRVDVYKRQEDLNQAIDSLNQTAAPLRKQLKQNENRMRAIAQIKDCLLYTSRCV